MFERESEGSGVWRIVSGVKGRTHEVTFNVNVRTNGKRLNKRI